MGLLRWLAGLWPRPDLPAWQRALDQARELMDQASYADALARLEPVRAAQQRFTGPEVAGLKAAVLAALGECLFNLGRAAEAAETTRRGLPLAGPDLRRELVGNLLEIHRWLGEPEKAAECADELARTAEPDGARRYAALAALLRAGEPLLRVVADVDGTRMELDEVLAGQAGKVRFAYARNRLTLRSAERLTQKGEQEAHQGRFAQALDLYDAAANLDPHAPEPHYQAGHALVYLGKYAGARVRFRKTEERAPGWFLVRSALWLVDQIAAGHVPPDTYRAWHAIAEGPLPAGDKLRLAEKAIAQAPHVPHLYQLRGRLLRERGLGFGAEMALRTGLGLADQPDVTARLCVDLAAVTEDAQEKTRLLKRAAAEDGDLVASATARLVLAFNG